MYQGTMNSRYYYSDSTINMGSISHLTGAFTAPLAQKIWEQSGHSEETMYSLFEWWEQMFNAGRERDLMESIKQVCGVLGHAFAEEISTAIQDPQIRNAFIISFLSDYDDALMDLAE